MDQLEKLKKEYIKTDVPAYLKTDGWYQLQQKLENRQKFNWYFAKTAYTAPALLFALLVIVFISLSAKPGSALYPLRVLSKDAIAQLWGKQLGKTEGIKDENLPQPSAELDMHTLNMQPPVAQESNDEASQQSQKQEEKHQKENDENRSKDNWLDGIFKQIENRHKRDIRNFFENDSKKHQKEQNQNREGKED